jgi:hypothetical protein
MIYPVDKVTKMQKRAILYNLYALFYQPVTQGMEKSPLGDFLQEAGFAVSNGDPWGVWTEGNIFRARYEAYMNEAEKRSELKETPADYARCRL